MTLNFLDDDQRCELKLYEWKLGRVLTDVLDLDIGTSSIESKFRTASFTTDFGFAVSLDNDEAIDRVVVNINRPQPSFNNRLPPPIEKMDLERGSDLEFKLTTSVRPVTLNLIWKDYTLPFKASDHGPLPPMLNYYSRVSKVFPNMINKKYENVLISHLRPPASQSKTNSASKFDFEIEIKGDIVHSDWDTIHVKAGNNIEFQAPVFVVDQVRPREITPRRYLIFKVPQYIYKGKMTELFEIRQSKRPSAFCALNPEHSDCLLMQKKSDPLAYLRSQKNVQKTNLNKDLTCVVLEVARYQYPNCVGKEVLVDQQWSNPHDPFNLDDDLKQVWKHTPDALIPRSYEYFRKKTSHKIIPTQGDIAQIGTLFNVDKTVGKNWRGKDWPFKALNPLAEIWDERPYFNYWDCCAQGVAYREKYPNETGTKYLVPEPSKMPLWGFAYRRTQCLEEMNWVDVFRDIIDKNPQIDRSVLAYRREDFNETNQGNWENLWDDCGFRRDTWAFDVDEFEPSKKIETNKFINYEVTIDTPFGPMYFDVFQDMVGHYHQMSLIDRIALSDTKACWGMRKFLELKEVGVYTKTVSDGELDCGKKVKDVLNWYSGWDYILDARVENDDDGNENAIFVTSLAGAIGALRGAPSSSKVLVYSESDNVGRSMRVAEFLRKQGFPNTQHLADGWMPERPDDFDMDVWHWKSSSSNNTKGFPLKGLEIPSSNVDARLGLSPREFRDNYLNNNFGDWYFETFNDEPGIGPLHFYEEFMMETAVREINEILRGTDKEVADGHILTRRVDSFENYLQKMPNEPEDETFTLKVPGEKSTLDKIMDGAVDGMSEIINVF